MNRRQFLKTTLLGTTALALPAVSMAEKAAIISGLSPVTLPCSIQPNSRTILLTPEGAYYQGVCYSTLAEALEAGNASS